MLTPINPTLTTEAGLVLKNVGRIEDIDTRMEVRTDANLRSWQCSRILRRDFNLVTAKMYIKCRDKRDRRQVKDLISEFVLRSEFLKAESELCELSYDLQVGTVPLRIVSPEASLLYKTFMDIDLVIAKLTCAEMDQRLTHEKAQEMPLDVFCAYSDLKTYVLGVTQMKTAAELGQENGIL